MTGLRTERIIDVQTKEGLLDNGGDVEILGGGRMNGSAELRVRGIAGQFKLLRDRPILQHHARRGTADAGSVSDSRPVLSGPDSAIFEYFSIPTTRLEPDHGICGGITFRFPQPVLASRRFMRFWECPLIRRLASTKTSSSRITSGYWRCRALSVPSSTIRSRLSAATRPISVLPGFRR